MNKLEVITGPMFSGKTTELLRSAESAAQVNKKILMVTPSIDERYDKEKVVTHPGQHFEPASCKAIILERGNETIEALVEAVREQTENQSLEKTDLICFDEANFFTEKLISLSHNLLERDKSVTLAGLNLDFRGEPFEALTQLYMEADKQTFLKACCKKCGRENVAIFTQRLTEEKEIAPADEPRIKLGAADIYEARCRNCFVRPQ